jgi:uncharacterized protein
MKIALISDIHDNLANLDLFFKLIEKEEIDKIVCCGDVCNLETLEKLSSGFTGEIFLVYGNAEIYQPEDISSFKNITFLKRHGQIEIDNLKIGLCHEPAFSRDLFNLEPNLNYIFYGHTHKPWMSIKNKAKLINPGTLGGVFYKPSFAIFDTKDQKIKLKLIHQ